MADFEQAQQLGRGVMTIIVIGLIGIIGILTITLLFHVWRRSRKRERQLALHYENTSESIPQPDVWESAAQRIELNETETSEDDDEEGWFPDRGS